MNSSNFVELLHPNLAKVSYAKYDKEDVYKKIINLRDPSNDPAKAYEQNIRVVGLGIMPVWNEDQARSADELAIGPSKSFWHLDYGVQVVFGRRLIRNEMYGLMKQVAGEIGYSAGLLRNTKTTTLYDNAFATTYYTGGDGLALITASHTLYGDGAATASNTPTTQSALSYTAVQDLMIIAATQKTDRGYAKVEYPNKLIVHPNNMHTAEVIVKTEFKPSSDANDISTVAGKITDFVVNPYSSQSAYWFLQCSEHEVHMNVQEDFSTKTFMDDETDSTIYAGQQVISLGFNDYRGNYGSQGNA